MNSRPLFVIAAAALVASGCANDAPLYVTGFFPLDPDGLSECKVTPGEARQYAGTLDVAGLTRYLLTVDLTSVLDKIKNTTSEDVLLRTGEERNTVYLDTIHLSYTSAGNTSFPAITFPTEEIPISIAQAPGSTQHIGMDLIGPRGYETLVNTLANPVLDSGFVSDGGFHFSDSIDIRVKFEFTGQINSGGRVKSSAATFPITVFSSGKTCPAGSFFCATGPCKGVGGQDGAPLICATLVTDGGRPECPVLTK